MVRRDRRWLRLIETTPDQETPHRGADETMAVAEPRDEDVMRRAYELYEQRGGRDGHDWDDWLQAERELQSADAVPRRHQKAYYRQLQCGQAPLRRDAGLRDPGPALAVPRRRRAAPRCVAEMIATVGPLHAWDTTVLVLLVGLIALVSILNWIFPPRR